MLKAVIPWLPMCAVTIGDEHWRVSSGIRVDDYDTVSGSSSTIPAVVGDLALEVGYRPGSDEDDGDWSIYGFGQGTVLRDGDRKRNALV